MKHATESTYDPSTHDESLVHPEPAFFKRISWGAIFAGLTAAVIIQMLLTLLGVGIGAATVNPLQEQAPGEGLGIGAAIWFFVSSLIAMYVGGRVAGRFSNAPAKHDRMLHGLFTWAATTILSAVFLTSALSSLLGSAAGTAAGTAVQAKSAQATPGQPGIATSPAVRDPAAVSANEQELRQAGEVAAKRLSQSALLTFFVLVLGGLAAAMGGKHSARRTGHDYIRRESETHDTPAFSKS